MEDEQDYEAIEAAEIAEMGYYEEKKELQDEIDQLKGQVVSLVADLGNRDDFIKRLMKELSRWGWGDFHYSNNSPQERSIVSLLEEGGFQYERDGITDQTRPS